MLTESAEVDDLLQPFFRKIRLRDELGTAEQQAIVAAADERRHYAAGEDLVSEGDRPVRSMLVVSGFTCRYRMTSEGRRQITAIHTAGDFVDLHSFLLKEMDHSVGALTNCAIITFPHERLVKVTERFPHLTRLLWLMTLLDGAVHREWLVGMGSLSAAQRTAHLICEIYTRLSAIGLARNGCFAFPITQAAMADATGISTVHVNRVIQELRQRELIVWEAGQVEIRNLPGLIEVADFDDRYLHHVQESR